MYVPRHFEVTGRAWILELIERHPFGMLVTADGEYPRVAQIPMVAQERDDAIWAIGHVAKANPHAALIAAEAPATLVFCGPHAYVSASWYEEPYETVPTWNYTAAHLCGRLRPYDPWRAVKLLSAKMEGERGWNPELLDPNYRAGQLGAIVAFELRADAIYAKAKLSQNRTDADRERVIERLLGSPNETDRECGDAMLAQLEVEQR
ncbi:MAG: FMN-binding negative transcriptional regulator [Candidatus Cybelea sp.]